MTGKIIKGIAGFYYVHDGHSRIYECKAKGVFRNKNIKPLVGDDVEFTVLDEQKGEGNIDEILPRKNTLVRPAVSNIDQAIIVFAIKSPEPNFNLLDRFLVMMMSQDVPVIICFNKIDLCDDDLIKKYRDIYEHAGYQVCFTSTCKANGFDQLRELLSHKTTVLAGPSGVGKSSMTNLFAPDAGMETGTISEKIQRGKHTTRHSELFYVSDQTYLMDTPGFSSMFTREMEPEELQDYFPEFEKYIPECRFKGCVHIGERQCGVKDAVAKGEISSSRYENYHLMYDEIKNKRRY